MASVIVGTLVMEEGCHLDGGSQSTLDFDLRVIHLAADKGGFDLSVEDAQRVFDAEHGEISTDGYAVISEIANDAVEHLNEVTQDGWSWHVEEQSLFLSSNADLEDNWYGRT